LKDIVEKLCARKINMIRFFMSNGSYSRVKDREKIGKIYYGLRILNQKKTKELQYLERQSHAGNATARKTGLSAPRLGALANPIARLIQCHSLHLSMSFIYLIKFNNTSH
jgi:hypothetical protein